jgi:N-acetylmuramoyl-L-alanine amidase
VASATMMPSMNLAWREVGASHSIFKLIFFTLLSALSAHAERWDSQGAQQAFQEARQKRAELSQAAKPSITQFLECAKSYRNVYVKDPHYGRAGDAIFEEAIIYQEMGDKFSDLDYYRTAAKRFLLLVKDYGGNQNCPEALERLGAIFSKRLDNEAAAHDAYNLLKRQYTHSPAALRLGQVDKETAKTTAQPKSVDNPKKTEIHSGDISSVKSVRFQSSADYTRVTIDMDLDADFEKNRLSGPDRVYLDISNARLSNDLQDRIFTVGDDILKQIRIAQNHSHVVRIVLDCVNAGDYSVVEQRNPFSIVIDLYRSSRKQIPPPSKPKSDSGSLVASSKLPPEIIQTPVQTASVVPKKTEPATQESSPKNVDNKSIPSSSSSPKGIDLPSTSNPKPEAASSKAPPEIIKAPVQIASAFSKKTEPAAQESAIGKIYNKPDPPVILPTKAIDLPSTSNLRPEVVSSGADAGENIAKIHTVKPPPPAAITPELTPAAPKAAMPTSRGDRTLTRTLGLKVGRIVIDPGHGGHDQGTIGPGGLAEKDLVLSLAISLQKMLQDELGAEVVLTRNDDTFIPLEERTAIANQHRADLFISIHANSSKIRSISGVETYYLSFAKTNAEREIAARENASTLSNVGDLEDLIKKIAQADKSAESRELASTVQKKLYSGARQLLSSTQNRGVRSAPFIVLIGANMPSVLAEVAFISNPKDERLLQKETNQEYLVKALFSGIEAYIKTLGSDENLNRQVQKQ